MFQEAQLHDFSALKTHYHPFVKLFTTRYDIVYDGLHCCTFIVTNIIIHSISFFFCDHTQF